MRNMERLLEEESSASQGSARQYKEAYSSSRDWLRSVSAWQTWNSN